MMNAQYVLRRLLPLCCVALSACSLVSYRPLEGIKQINPDEGYRLEKSMTTEAQQDENFVVMMFSGGGSRAAAFGYGVLEEMKKRPFRLYGQDAELLEQVDLVYGVSGGSILAAYFAMHGAETVPSFENRFLKYNFQRTLVKQVLSAANMPRLASPQFGRGDLLQEQLENQLFGHATFGDLLKRRKGPFAVISATDMTAGRRVDFTQEYFDAMCLNLSKLRISRAVAASSAVPLVFSPLTLNNNGGNCAYKLPDQLQQALDSGIDDSVKAKNREEFAAYLRQYENSQKRPYIHLLDGGLTDNLGLRNLLDLNALYSANTVRGRLVGKNTRRVIIIAVNAQNQIDSDIDTRADVPGFRDQLEAIINVPIDQYTQESVKRFREAADEWNKTARNGSGEKVRVYFINLSLRDLPESELRSKVLNIPTTFYLPHSDVAALKAAAPVLLERSEEYKRLLQDLAQPLPQPTAPLVPQMDDEDKDGSEQRNDMQPERR